jgi:L-iditol 2-dehydrogenase
MAPSLVEIVPQKITSQKSELNGAKSGSVLSCCVTDRDVASSTTEEISRAKNPSLQVTADHTIKMVEAPVLRPGPKDVLLHIKVTGICGFVMCPISNHR